jgi:hypothetical protein
MNDEPRPRVRGILLALQVVSRLCGS